MKVSYEMDVFDVLEEVIFHLNSKFEILGGNRRVEDLGFDLKVLKGKVLEVLISPQYRRVFRASIETSFKLWNITKAKLKILNANGDHIPVEARILPKENNGRVEFFVVLKPEYGWNFQIFNDLPYPVIVLGKSGILFLNSKALKLSDDVDPTGLNEGDEVEIGGISYKVAKIDSFHNFSRVNILIFVENPRIDPRLEKFAIAGIMSSLISHDLKNSLTTLTVLLENVGDENLKGRLKRIFERIKKLHLRVINVIKPSLKVSEFSLKELVEEILDDFQHKLPSRGIEVEMSFGDDFTLKTDRDIMYEVLHNLISNALEASPYKGKIMIFSGISQKEGKIYKFVSVRDFGKGIERENLSRIFDPFFTTKEGGTGLGLFIVRKFVKVLGGEIEVKSEVGKGSEFLVYLPDL